MSTLLALLLACPSAAAPQEPPVLDLVEVHLRGTDEWLLLQTLATDLDDHHPPGADGSVWLYADDAEQARLRRAGLRLEVLQEDLASFYAARAAADAGAARGLGGSMGGFKTLAEIEAEMDALAAAWPNVVSPRFSVGQSWEGRDIWAMRVSDNPLSDEPGEPNAWFDALHHAREPMSGESVLLLAEYLASNYGVDPEVTRLVDTRDILILPCVNPDGYEYNRQTNPNGGGMWRKNRRDNGGGSFGVDLNRNYDWEWGPQWNGSSGNPNSDIYRGPAPFSEPETAALRDFLAQQPPVTAISAHTYSNLWLWPWAYHTIYTPDEDTFQYYGGQLAATNGWAAGTVWEVLYTANGDAGDYHYGQHGTWAISPEIGSNGDGFWPAPSRIPGLWDAVRPGYLLMARWAGAWVEQRGSLWTEVLGDGDADLEAGETWRLDLDLWNDGALVATGGVTLRSSAPEVQVDLDQAPFQLAPRSGALAGPLQVTFAPSAEAGVGYVLELDLEWEGEVTSTEMTVFLGSERILALDDMEAADFGWTVTSTGSNYGFERADPEATTSSGQTVQPGDDHTAGAGRLCWVTGAAAGSSSGTNDVDGTTTLTSPRFRASGFPHLRLEYARWFANLPGSAQDDRLVVEISADDGATWTLLEETGNANNWTVVGFDLEDFTPLSDRMRLRFTAADDPNNDLTEALVDDLVLSTRSTLPTLGAWGRVAPGTQVQLRIHGPAGVPWRVQYSLTAGNGVPLPGTEGLFYLTGSVRDLASGSLDAAGQGELLAQVPGNPGLSGRTVFLQALVDENGPEAAWSNLLSVEIE